MDRLPDVGCVKSSSILTIVVFPAPLGPRRAKYSPALTENETLSTAVREPYRLVAAFNSIMNEVYVLRHGTVNKIWRFMQMIMERTETICI
jgi:predicted oxidoreductase (fatty acid repression mutant protein)